MEVTQTAASSYGELIKIVRDDGIPGPSRMGPILELPNPQVLVGSGEYWTRPGFSPTFAALEALQIIAGFYDPEPLPLAAPKLNMSLFTPEGAYGPRLVGQMPGIVRELREVPDSRRAVAYVGKFSEPLEQRPCTTSLQWRRHLKNPKILMCYVAMRSWDLYLGLPYDIFAFQMLNQAVAQCVGCYPGHLEVTAGSAHLYDKDRGFRPAAVPNMLSNPFRENLGEGCDWAEATQLARRFHDTIAMRLQLRAVLLARGDTLPGPEEREHL